MTLYETLGAALVAATALGGVDAPRAATATPTAPPREPVRVVATLPVYASLAREIGGDEVDVQSIADPNEDSHFVRPKPSFALALRRADLFVTTGLDLELWVPALLDKAGNGRVLEGGPGYVTAYTGIELLDIPASADRSQGDVHIYGNPHLHTDPLRAIQVARNITTGLKRVAPDRAERWDRGFASLRDRIHRRTFGDELVEILGGETLERLALNGDLRSFLAGQQLEGEPLTGRLGGWLGAAAAFEGRDIICYHKNWAYFEQRFGVRCVDYVETKPGIPPTPRHVVRLLSLMREQDIGVLLAASYFDEGKVENVARRGNAIPVVVPLEVEATREIRSYFDLVDHWISELDEAFEDAGAR